MDCKQPIENVACVGDVKMGRGGGMEVGEGEECQQGAFLFLPPPHALEFSLTLPLLTPATLATENIKFNKKYMAHPIVSQMPKAGNSRLDNFFHPFLPFFFLLLLPFLIVVN